MEKKMDDVASQPELEPEEVSLMPKDRLKRFFLAVPALSLIVGGVLLVVEVVVIILVLAAPSAVGVTEDAALTPAQRGVLGAASVVMLIEAVLLGFVDIGTNRQRARLIKSQRNALLMHLNKLQGKVKDTDFSAESLLSLQKVCELLTTGAIASRQVRLRLKRIKQTEKVEEMKEEVHHLNQELNHHTLNYMANLVFELASFLWKWALALLVISNNWLSVGVAIAGGVIYPLVTFWQKAIDPTP